MSRPDLDILERDVEAARNRLVGDIERLREPVAMSGFRNDVMAKVSSVKDDLVSRATDVAADAAQSVWSDLKGRASANPGAVLAIGAGLAWHLARHPPITTLLVGLGLSSLIRTDPSSGPSPIVTRTTEVAGTVKETVERWGEEAHDAVGELSQQAREWSAKARDRTEDMIAETSRSAAALADRSSRLAKQAFPDREVRDSYLLGAAALAIGAATVIAIQRKNGEA
jgi:hypothetical protein